MEGEYFVVAHNSSLQFFENQAHILDNLYVRAGLILVYSIIFVFVFLGNLAVILVVTLQWKAPVLARFYMGNMAAANLFVAIFCIPQKLTFYLRCIWIFGELILHFVTSVCHTASTLILFIVSIERYMTLVHGFKGGPVLTVRRLQVVMLFLWMLSAGVSLPRFFYCSLIQIPVDDKGRICVLNRSMYTIGTADTIYFLVLYALPVAIMLVMYFRIEVHYRKNGGVRTVLNGKTLRDASRESNDAERRGTLVRADNAPRTSMASPTTCSAVFKFHGQPVPANSMTLIKDASTTRESSQKVESLVPSTRISAHGLKLSKASHRLRPRLQNDGLRLSRVQYQEGQDVIRMLKYNVVSFALLNLPFHLRYELHVGFSPSFDMSCDVNDFMAPLTFVLMYANCGLNPILYVAISKRFRGSLRDLIRKFFRAFSRILGSM